MVCFKLTARKLVGVQGCQWYQTGQDDLYLEGIQVEFEPKWKSHKNMLFSAKQLILCSIHYKEIIEIQVSAKHNDKYYMMGDITTLSLGTRIIKHV